MSVDPGHDACGGRCGSVPGRHRGWKFWERDPRPVRIPASELHRCCKGHTAVRVAVRNRFGFPCPFQHSSPSRHPILQAAVFWERSRASWVQWPAPAARPRPPPPTVGMWGGGVAWGGTLPPVRQPGPALPLAQQLLRGRSEKQPRRGPRHSCPTGSTADLAQRLEAEVKALTAARGDAGQATKSVRDKEREISELREKLARGYGPDAVWAALEGACFQAPADKYTYEMCPYGGAKQLEGGSSMNLGRWETPADDASELFFKHGSHCWNGPSRSLTASRGGVLGCWGAPASPGVHAGGAHTRPCPCRGGVGGSSAGRLLDTPPPARHRPKPAPPRIAHARGHAPLCACRWRQSAGPRTVCTA